jgi:hypothetical protein
MALLGRNYRNHQVSVMKKLTIAKSLFVAAAGVSFLFSVYLWFGGQREEGLFVGLWVPSILSLGALMFASRGRAGS